MKKKRKGNIFISLVALLAVILTGCGDVTKEESNSISSENIIITETGEVLPKNSQVEEDITKGTAPREQEEAEISIVSENPTEHVDEEDTPNIEESEDKYLQIVFMGDSIFDFNRDGTGVPELTAVQCNAYMYNLAIGGTSAALEKDDTQENEKWTSTSLVGLVKAMKGDVSTECFAGTAAKDILDDPNTDWSETDYFVVEYGLNDFFKAIPQGNINKGLDVTTYAGALRYAITFFRDMAPDATIILCSPHYVRFFDGDWMIGDSNTIDNGSGTLSNYKGTCEYIAGEQQVEFFNAYSDLGIDGYTAEEYLEDGVHLTESGRRLYADALAQIILNYEETKNN